MRKDERQSEFSKAKAEIREGYKMFDNWEELEIKRKERKRREKLVKLKKRMKSRKKRKRYYAEQISGTTRNI